MLSLTLFLVFIHDILHQMPQNIPVAIYADGLASSCSEEYFITTTFWLQQALQVIETWARSWLVKVNKKRQLLQSSVSPTNGRECA